MKDELNGLKIDKAIFLGIKEYVYMYRNDKGDIINKSVFAGVPRDSLSFNEGEFIFNGGTIVKNVGIRFFKSFKDLSIRIRNVTISIHKNNDKILVNNKYIPLHINNLKHPFDNRTLFIKIKNKIINFLNKFNIKT
jgi:hypothetical protein